MEAETFGLTGGDFGSRLNQIKKPQLQAQKPAYEQQSVSKELKPDEIFYTKVPSKTSRNEDAQKKELFQTTSTFPSIHHHNKKTIMKSQNFDSGQEYQSIKVLDSKNKKFDTLKSVLESMRAQKNEKLGKHAFIEQYDDKLTERYNTLYDKEPREKVIKQLITLEKKQFLQSELTYKEFKTELGKKKFNQLRYEVQKQEKYLINLNQQINDIESLFPKTNLVELHKEKKTELKRIKAKIQTELFNQQTLEHMRILLFVKNDCTNLNDELHYVNIHQSVQEGHYQIRQNHKKDLLQEYKFFDESGDFKKHYQSESFFLASKEKLGKKFNEMMEDTLSEFEETKALGKTLKHEQILENERISQLEAQRQAIEQKNQYERNLQYEKVMKEERKTKEQLRNWKNIFFQIKQVTGVQNLEEFNTYQQKYEKEKESMEKIQEYLSNQIKAEKKIIQKSRENIKRLKFDNEQTIEQQCREVKFDTYETKLLEKTNETEELENNIRKLERTIDGICTVSGRVLYQLSNQKKKNAEVKREDLLNSISALGLKLERMLTILQKRKNNFRIESINTDGGYSETPNFLGLSQKKIYLKKDDNNDINYQQYFNDADINLIKNVDSEDEFLASQVEELKHKYELKPQQKAREKDLNRIMDKAIFKGLKGINI